jgi:hypothetical protein
MTPPTLSTGLATSIKQVQSSTTSGDLKYLPAQKLSLKLEGQIQITVCTFDHQ